LCAWEEGDLRTICWVQEVPFFGLSTLWPAHFSAGHAKCKLCENRQLDGCYAFISVTSGCIVAETGMINVFSIIALGFFLGMRHATDPDHVIAVSTIVSRERNVAKSAWVGAVWGVGHTLTIFVVGAALILLGLVAPQQGNGGAQFHISPLVGLLMDLAVAVMLIVLGIGNLRRFWRCSWTFRLGVSSPAGGAHHSRSEMVGGVPSRFRRRDDCRNDADHLKHWLRISCDSWWPEILSEDCFRVRAC